MDESQRIDVDYLVESSGGQRTSGPSYGGTGAWKGRMRGSVPVGRGLLRNRVLLRVTVAIVIVGVHRRMEERARGKEKNDENDGGQKDRYIDFSPPFQVGKWGLT